MAREENVSKQAMGLHPLQADSKCPRCGSPGLVFVKRRGGRGIDLYRCTGPSPCRGYALHCRRNGNRCGIAIEVDVGRIALWKECPG